MYPPLYHTEFNSNQQIFTKVHYVQSSIILISGGKNKLLSFKGKFTNLLFFDYLKEIYFCYHSATEKR